MTISRLTLLCLAVSTCLSACSTPPYTDYDTTYPFAQADSFFVVAGNSDNDPLMAERVQTAIHSELSKRGLQAATSAQLADLSIRYSLHSEDRPNNNRVSVGMGTGSYGGSGGVAIGGSVSRPVGGDTRPYTTIQIDMYPSGEKRLIWRGRDAMELRGDPTRRAEDAQRLVQRLLATFPP